MTCRVHVYSTRAVQTFNRPHINIHDDGIIQFPVPEDGVITLRDIQDAFPGTIGFRFKDEDCSSPSHILCRDGVFVEPLGGWCRPGRKYFIMKGETKQSGRFNMFERYRQDMERNRADTSGHGGRRKSKNESTGMVKLHVGRGSFKSGTFKKLTGNSQGGGLIVVGPFDKDADCVTEIRNEAFRKFQSLHREFRKQYHTANDMTLVYPDGSKVCGLPDGSADFSIKGYRDYLDPHKKYDRLRFFLVPTVEISEEVELVSADESSDSLPDLSDTIESQTLSTVLHDIRRTAHEAKDQEEECESSCSHPLGTSSQIDLTYDDTLPLTVKVRFTSNGHAILTGRFEISDKIEELVRYVQSSGTLQCNNFQLLKNGEILETTIELNNYIGNPNEVVEIEVKPVVERSERVFAGLGRRRRLSLRRNQSETCSTGTELTQVSGDLDESEISALLEKHADTVLLPTPNEDMCYFNGIHVSRYYVLEDFMESVEALNFDFKKKVKVQFISNFGEHQDIEIAIDEGGPRREFFRLLMDALVHTSGLLEGPETMKVFSSKVSALRKKHYYYAGYAVAASILMGGQPLCCLAPSVVDFLIKGQSDPTLEEVTDYEVRDALKELTDSDTTENMRKILDEKLELRFSLGVDKPTFLLDIADKEDLVKDICLSFVIHRTTASINQFADGMEVLGLMTLMRRYPALRHLLAYNNRFEITPKRFKEACTFNFCENGSNRRPVEERLAKRFLDYVDEIYREPRQHDEHEINLQSLFGFITGLSRLPGVRLNNIHINFDHEATDGSLPRANTCGFMVILPVYESFKDKAIFGSKFDIAILYAGGMHAL